MIEIIIYLLSGALVGFFAGLFGIGGGLILVPILASTLHYFQGTDQAVHLAIGTTLATIFITSLSSVRTHHQHHAIEWPLVRSLVPGIILGSFIGSWVAKYLPGNSLAQVFGIFELLIAFYMLANIKPRPHGGQPSRFNQSIAGIVIGSFSTIIGIGGGTLTTPYLVWHNVLIQRAIATSAACGLIIALAGTLGFMFSGLHLDNLPAYSTGYIYWPAFMGIVVTSVLTAPKGANMTHHLPIQKLKRYFAVLLILLAIKMLCF